jgi:hypothetical protein
MRFHWADSRAGENETIQAYTLKMRSSSQPAPSMVILTSMLNEYFFLGFLSPPYDVRIPYCYMGLPIENAL